MAYDDEIVSQIRLRAVDETGDVMRGMSQRINDTTSAFAKLGKAIGGEEAVRRSFTSFAELSRTLERLQLSAKVSDQQMSALGETFDDVAKRTGRSSNEVAKAFANFTTQTGQQFTPMLEKMFKTIGEASEITGTSIESLSRAAGAAMNNMKVPQEQMDELIRKWAIELPNSLEAFAHAAPRVTESMNALGLTGAKNAEEIALVFNSLNNSFGNTRVAASALNELLGQMSEGSTTFGKMMMPTLMQVRQHGGDVVEVFESMHKQLEAMHAFDPNQPPFLRQMLGLSFNEMKALQAIHDNLAEINKRIKEGEDSAKVYAEVLGRMDKDPLSAIHKLSAGFENLKMTFGSLMVAIGASEALQGLAKTMDQASKAVDYLVSKDKTPFAQRFEGEAPRRGMIRSAITGTAAGVGLAVGIPVGKVVGGVLDLPGGGAAGAALGTGYGEHAGEKISDFLLGGLPSEEALQNYARRNKLAGPKKFARGGTVNEPTLATIGEGGPEEVVPLNGSGGGGSSTKENTIATEENTGAILRLSSYMRDTGRRGIYMNAAYTPGAGESPKPSEAGLYGGGSGGGSGHGASGSWGGGGSGGNPALRGQVPQSFGSGGGRGSDPRGLIPYIRQKAIENGIDPDIAVRVAMSEGLNGFSGDNGTSFGAFQLHTGGGMGDEFHRDTGLDPSDPKNEKATIDYALSHAGQTGWGPWHGAASVGIGARQGLGMDPAKLAAREQSLSGSINDSSGNVLQRQGQVAGVRRGALDSNLLSALKYASAKTGLTADVTSGGQRMEGAPGATGSHRHDNGRAADFNLRDNNGNIVSPNDPRALEFYRHAASAGVTGGGEGYMSDPNKIHLDVGTENMGSPVYAGSRAFREAIEKGKQERAVKGKPSDTAHALKEHQSMREEMERPIKMSVEAPKPPPLYSYRQRMARQQSRYQSDDVLGASRYASNLDIGFA